ncbi:MAG: MFS transporter [Myxococcota bacterium]
MSTYSWYVLTLLFFVYLSNHIDRQILNILLEPIKKEFGASDFMMGMLVGPTFALFYATAGIPIARLADRASRRNIIAISAAVWSVMTALSGTARTFVSLALFRVGVGIGEAGCSPPSHSLISDYFPAEKRGRALGVYAMATQAGAAFGWLLGGWLFYWMGWRWAFIAAGIPGILLALLVRATVKEPRRGRMERGPVDSDQMPTKEAIRHLLGQRSFVWLQAGGALHAVAGYGLGVWVAPFLIRIHGMELQVIGTWLGGIALLAGMPGMFLAGFFSDRLAIRDARWYLWIPTLSALVSAPFTIGFLFFADPNVGLVFYAIHALLGMGYAAPTFAMTQAVVKVRARSLAVAVHLLLVNLVGLGIGPVLIGGLNDLLYDDLGEGAIRYTMLLAALTNVVACGFYLMAARTVRRDIEHRED